MTTRTEDLKLIISGDGKLLGAELGRSERKVKTFGSRIGGVFSGLNKKIASSVKTIATNPLTLFGGAAGVMYAGKQLIEYKDALSTIGINAGMTDAEIVKLNETMTRYAYDTGQNRDKLVASISDVYDKTGDAAFAIKSLFSTGRSSTAMSADIMNTGRVVSSLRIGLKATVDEVEEYLDIMARMGNIGSFTFAQQASQAERLFSAAVLGAGITKRSFAEYNAFMQSVKPMFGSADMAGTAIESIMNRFKTDQSKIERKIGFKLFDEKGSIRDFKKTVLAISKLSPKVRKKLFGEYSKAFTVFEDQDAVKNYEQMIVKGQQAGFITEAFARKQKESKFQINALTTAAKDFADAGLTPIIGELTKELNELTSNPEKMNDFISSLREVAEALSAIAKIVGPISGIINLISAPFLDVFTSAGKGKKQMSTIANKAYKSLSSSERKKLDKDIDNSKWESSKYNVLLEKKPSALLNVLNKTDPQKLQEVDTSRLKEIVRAAGNIKNDVNINVQITESGRIIAKTTDPNTVTRVTSNRGSFSTP